MSTSNKGQTLSSGETVDDILQVPMKDTTRLILQHVPTSTFRWMGLVEIVVLILGFCFIVLPLFVVAIILTRGSALSAGGAMDVVLPSIDRFHYTWHDIQIKALGSDGKVLYQRTQRCVDANQGELLVASVLDAARRQNILVVETIGNETQSQATRWYGGHPLMAPPNRPTVDLVWERLERSTCTRHSDEKNTTVQFVEGQPSTLTLLVRLIAMAMGFPLFIKHANRKAFKTTWFTLRTRSPPTWTFNISADRIFITHCSGQVVQQEFSIDGQNLLGFTWAPSLSYGSKVVVCPHTVQLVGLNGRQHIHLPESIARHIVDYLIAESLRLRAKRPELELPFGEAPPTRCPYCGSLYVFKSDTSCPTCGGWPDKVGVS